jgi:uncharacterized protein YfaS (alpha-2-macroglobulin family)
MDHPDRIELDLDKDSYLPGETAQVQVRAPFAGKLLLTIEREKVRVQSHYNEREHGDDLTRRSVISTSRTLFRASDSFH